MAVNIPGTNMPSYTFKGSNPAAISNNNTSHQPYKHSNGHNPCFDVLLDASMFGINPMLDAVVAVGLRQSSLLAVEPLALQALTTHKYHPQS